MSALLTMAFDINDILVNIDSVQRGIKCKCHCPKCNKPLYAKNGGSKREHHFAHAHGCNCEGYYETTLHKLAKQIIKENSVIMLPESEDQTKPSGLVALRNVEIEKWDDFFHIKPDVEAVLENGQRILIELLVTHKVDSKKYNIITENNLLCVEIDLNYLKLDENVIIEYLTQDSEGRRWIVKETKKESDGYGSFYTRNPKLDDVRDLIKTAFDNKRLSIHQSIIGRHTETYNLSDFGYVYCDVNTKFRGFKCDLLLYRESKDNNYISINIRGRRRNQNQRLPKDLRIIDVIIPREASDTLISSYSEGLLSESSSNVIFSGKWKIYKCVE